LNELSSLFIYHSERNEVENLQSSKSFAIEQLVTKVVTIARSLRRGSLILDVSIGRLLRFARNCD
jgi:hypothetical protein